MTPDVIYRIPFFTSELERFDVIRWTKRELVAVNDRGDISRFSPKDFHEFEVDPMRALKLAIQFLKWKKIDPQRLKRFERELVEWKKLH